MHTYAARVIADQATGRPLAGVRVAVEDAETGAPVQPCRDGQPVTLVTGAHGLITEWQTEDTTRRVALTAGPVRLTQWCEELQGTAADAVSLMDDRLADAASAVSQAATIRDGLEPRVQTVEARQTALESAEGFGPSTPEDGTTASYLSQATSLTAKAATVMFSRGTATVSDRYAPSLQALVDEARPGDTVLVSRAWSLAEPLTISTPLRLRTLDAGEIYAPDRTKDGVVVTSDDVELAARIRGAGATTAGAQRLVRVAGASLASPVRRFALTGSTITDAARDGVQLEWCDDWTIEDCDLSHLAYSAITTLSASRGVVRKSRVANVLQPTGFVNSYGFTASRRTDQPLSTHPRSSQIRVDDLTVDGVPKWEGIDTHAGENITIRDSTVRNCRVGIALVPGVDASGVDDIAPKGIRVINNDIDSGVSDGTRGIGIQAVGALNADGTMREALTGTIEGNTIRGHGTDGTATSGAIMTQATSGLSVRGNTIVEPAMNGVIATTRNEGLRVEGNTVVDAWTDKLGYTSVLRVTSHNNSIRLTGNDAVRGSRTAAVVHGRGLYVSSSLSGVSVRAEGNDFTSASLPMVDGGLSYAREGATKLSFHPTAEPVTRPTLRGAATDELTARALVNQLRTALIGYGLAN